MKVNQDQKKKVRNRNDTPPPPKRIWVVSEKKINLSYSALMNNVVMTICALVVGWSEIKDQLFVR